MVDSFIHNEINKLVYCHSERMPYAKLDTDKKFNNSLAFQ